MNGSTQPQSNNAPKISELISINDTDETSQNNLNINYPMSENSNIVETKLISTAPATTQPTNVVTATPAPTTSANSNTNSHNNHFFSVGDKVKVDVSLEVFKQMQEGHGGWNFKMADVS